MKKLLIVIFLVACQDNGSEGNFHSPDASLEFGIVSTLDGAPSSTADSNIPILNWDAALDASPPDASEDPCREVTVQDHENYCSCRPQCCELQEWYCPPGQGTTIQSMQVTVETCNELGEECEFGVDPDCPPPEIIHRSECQITHDCPPGSSRDFLRWFECRLEDGRTGRQRVLCDKGQIIHGPCLSCEEEEVCDNIDNDCDERIDEDPVPCEDECGPGLGLCVNGQIIDCVNREPSEDVCNFIDDDCDGEIDEGQRNACDECGELPPDICDGLDNDCDESVDEDLIRECETLCGTGFETCLDSRWLACTAPQPAEEECDGLDNDCDGQLDEGIECECTIDQVGALFPCTEPPLICGQGFKSCVCEDEACMRIIMSPCMALCAFLPLGEGEECHPGLGRPVLQEVCNNFDEDCDDLLDESLSRACYTGPRDTVNVGICIPGEQTCVEGRWGASDPGGIWAADICGGEVVPTEEICNGADDNCDGEVDYGEEIRATDILLVIDTSGSMDGEIRAVTSALSRFGQHFAAEEAIHWGVIVGPLQVENPLRPFDRTEVLTLASDILPFEEFFNLFTSLDPSIFDGGMEMHMDAVMLALRNLSPGQVDLQNRTWIDGVSSNPPVEQFVVNWREDTDRIIIVFTDEEEQSYLDPEFRQNDLSTALAVAPNTRLYTFALEHYGWDELANGAGGRNFPLTSRAQEMFESLMTILDEICLPRNMEEQGAFLEIGNPQIPEGYSYMLANMSLPGPEYLICF